ncbi:MAG: hypothetical protein J6A90_07705 [Clostridia bacterium]|nr:hypothetical protein [Clostridia bacterium]
MKKTNELFKILIPVMLGATAIAVLFASLALCLTYTPDHGNIDMKSAHAIFFVTTILIALVAPILFVVAFKDLKITRTKRDLLFGKIASTLVLISLFAYTISDMIYMTASSFQVWRFFRALVSVLVMIFAVIEILPSKTKVSPFIKNVVNGCAPVYTALSILTLYFSPTYIPEYFKILYTIAYSILTLFFLYDFKWRLVPTNAKAYTAISTMAFTLPVIISLASVAGYIFRNGDFVQSQITVSIFEMIFVCTLGIYALSKVLAVKKTVEYVVVESQKRLEKKALKAKKLQEEEDAKFEERKSALEAEKRNASTENAAKESTDTAE